MIYYLIIFVSGALFGGILSWNLAEKSLNRKINGYIHIARKISNDEPYIFLELANHDDMDKMIEEGYVSLKVTRD